MVQNSANDIETTSDYRGKETACLDKGFVRLVDYMGDDDSIVQAARVSYGSGTKRVLEDRGLIRYLMRHHHTTPFEMVEFKFHIKLPIFVARQWIRHRTANVNEYSGRYSVMKDEFYVPEPETVRKQSSTNKQGRSDETLSIDEVERYLAEIRSDQSSSYQRYEGYLEQGVAREIARINLPVSNYTEWYWKIDLHNLFHFLRLRLDAHAQYEIRVYAEAMAEMVKAIVPVAYEAFEDYSLGSMRLSRLEVNALARLLNGDALVDQDYSQLGLKGRELKEFQDKLSLLGQREGEM